ncbi:hypothetical protein MMC28_006790 [Mycoblastus sanguinarius]|nr:hypothetical protein [Mycoblastus sanguinarius]
MRLPREVRDEVYYYYFLKKPQQGHTPGSPRSPSTWYLPPVAARDQELPMELVRVNHTIYGEAQNAFFSRFTFAWPCWNDTKVVHDFLNPFNGYVGNLIRSIEIHYAGCHMFPSPFSKFQERTKWELKEEFEKLVRFLPGLRKVKLIIMIGDQSLPGPKHMEFMLGWALDIASPFKKLNGPRALRAVSYGYDAESGYEVVKQFNARIDAGTW